VQDKLGLIKGTHDPPLAAYSVVYLGIFRLHAMVQDPESRSAWQQTEKTYYLDPGAPVANR